MEGGGAAARNAGRKLAEQCRLSARQAAGGDRRGRAAAAPVQARRARAEQVDQGGRRRQGAVRQGAGGGAPGLVTGIDGAALDAALDAATNEAETRGVFGAPTMYVGDEMFFGNDRFDFIRASLGVAA